MMKHLINVSYKFAFIFTIQITVNCNSGDFLSRDNNKIQVSQMYQHKSSETSSNRDYLFGKSSATLQGTHNISSTCTRKLKKWQLDKVTRKQYEIINILWKKTKLFVNVDTSTAAYQSIKVNETQNLFHTLRHQESYQLSPSYSKSQASTSSYIEFYYMDETNVYVKPKDFQNPSYFNRKNKSTEDFHLKLNMINNSSKNNSLRTTESTKINDYVFTIPDSFIDNETCPYTTELHATANDHNDPNSRLKQKSYIKPNEEPTTVYDKIKFFEIYDKYTVTYPKKSINTNERDAVENDEKKNKSHVVQRILLEHVDNDISYSHGGQHKIKHAKKHIRENFKNKSTVCSDKKQLKFKNLFSIPILDKINTTYFINPIKPLGTETKTLHSYLNRSALWSEYPFAAVYIYEPAQVHCDAAGISPHWLVMAGACLSRHHGNPSGEGRSAFVTFCGESWWQPKRVAYVKYSLIHPRYHPRDRVRSHLYNIGVVQVVNSMSSCTSWSPIPLMSHQYTTDPEGSLALALGWGLDRYDTRYAFMDLPKWPLMVYEGIVYSNSCPGNMGYSKAKRLEGEGGTQNVYCLSLPPYAEEENDPIHGSILLVGGKLVALYLQEERRSWGEQSAQYTGTWHLIPWVLEVAREPEVEDSFTFEI